MHDENDLAESLRIFLAFFYFVPSLFSPKRRGVCQHRPSYSFAENQ